jgi:hypothetical protein
MTGHGLAADAIPDAGAFLVRLTRLNPATLVRLRPAGGGSHVALWARLPWEALVTRTVAGAEPVQVTVAAGDLLAELRRGGDALPARRDRLWRWPLPPSAGRVVERVAGAELRRVAEAAAGALREAASGGVGGRAVGQRAIRDALLDHVAIVVTEPGADAAVEVPQRLVQAIIRMGFLGSGDGGADEPVDVRVADRWVGLAAPYGTAWLRPAGSFPIRLADARPRLNG